MRVDVVGRNLQITDPIRAYAEEKAGKLTKFYDGLQQVTVTIVKADHHHHASFDVEVLLDVEKHDDFVCHAKGDDLYGTIDQALQKGSRMLSDFKERLKQGNR